MSALKKPKITHLESAYVHQEKQKQQRLVKRRKGLMRRLVVFSVLAAGLLLFMVNALFHQAGNVSEKSAYIEELQAQTDQLETQKQTLSEEVMNLQNEDYVLDVARRDYFYSKDDEIIFKRSSENPSY
ncbi:FtsB family cell division protein [Aureibacillus halotolerans]|uniref:Cell division protein DivIC n=1 Tax=Aureibacillus halotolerans TaxID=1508390 RepID=A0A4V3D4B0_9BACI|nr:septum formation initiator family protein [Aureibacillus halotolerans]TDQ34218.1 cell division protein DivIC [Aureibacillus halotolerans]